MQVAVALPPINTGSRYLLLSGSPGTGWIPVCQYLCSFKGLIVFGGCLVALNAAPGHLSTADGDWRSASAPPPLGWPLKSWRGGARKSLAATSSRGKSMRLADTGGSGLSNGTKETPSGLPGGQGSLLDVLVRGRRQRQVCLCAQR